MAGQTSPLKAWLEKHHVWRVDEIVYSVLGLLGNFLFWYAIGKLQNYFLGTPFDWLQWLLRHMGAATSLVATIGLGIIGYLLFLLKTHHLRIYASAEICFALFNSYLAVNRIRYSPNVANAAVIAASVYLIVRGLDNRKKALDDANASQLRDF